MWKDSETAHLDLNTHAGQAWINLRTPLGHYSQYPPQYPPFTPQTPTNHQYPHHSHTTRSPSYFRRQQCRKAAQAADVTITNTVKTSAEQVEYTSTHNNTLTEKVDSQYQEIETSAEQVESTTTHNTTSTEEVDSDHQEIEPDINTNEAAKLTCTINPTTHTTANPTISTKPTKIVPTTPATTTPTTPTTSITPTTPPAMEPTTGVEVFREIMNDSLQQLLNTIDPTTPTTVIPTISNKTYYNDSYHTYHNYSNRNIYTSTLYHGS